MNNPTNISSKSNYCNFTLHGHADLRWSTGAADSNQAANQSYFGTLWIIQHFLFQTFHQHFILLYSGLSLSLSLSVESLHNA